MLPLPHSLYLITRPFTSTITFTFLFTFTFTGTYILHHLHLQECA
jgi:hypothetical protein